ncbi:MAG: hypothetical protein HGA31_03045 [Candidatus Moranbacteria bacterium]|nr:hypothetical protein [Candidatus Moranbacteria bacterium]
MEIFFQYLSGTERMLVRTNSYSRNVWLANRALREANSMLVRHGLPRIKSHHLEIVPDSNSKTVFIFRLPKTGLPTAILNNELEAIGIGRVP